MSTELVLPENPQPHEVGYWMAGRKPGLYGIAGNPALTTEALGRAAKMLPAPKDLDDARVLRVHPSSRIAAERAARRVCEALNMPFTMRLTTDLAPGEWTIEAHGYTLWSVGPPRIAQ